MATPRTPAPQDLRVLTFHAPRHPLELVARRGIHQDLEAHLVQAHRRTGAAELVYLGTCQRATWILWGGQAEALNLVGHPTRFEGAEAWRHLLELACGLHSATLGDRDILVQLDRALAQARSAGVAGPDAEAAFEDLLREARRLRSRLRLDAGSTSMATVALHHLETGLAPGSRVALVGVGPMTRYLAERLPARGLEVVMANRTQGKAEALGLPTVPLSQLQASPEGFQALVTATASPHPLFTLEAWGGLGLPPLRLLDLALPPDSEPALASLPWIHRVDLEALTVETGGARARRQAAARGAESVVREAVARLQSREAQRRRRAVHQGAFHTLAQAWDTLEQEALAGVGPFQAFGPLPQDPLRLLLKRGRTLAYRTLYQGLGAGEGRTPGA